MQNRYLLKNYDFELPKELIRQVPPQKRSYSRMMALKGGRIVHSTFERLIEIMDKGDMIILNRTKVRKTLAYGQKNSGEKVQITFLEFLSFAHKTFPDSIFVLDNALYRHASVINDYANLTGIRLFFLPPYSPDLNPIERVWKFVRKKATHNVYFASLEYLKNALVRQFSIYRKESREIRQLCTIN